MPQRCPGEPGLDWSRRLSRKLIIPPSKGVQIFTSPISSSFCTVRMRPTRTGRPQVRKVKNFVPNQAIYKPFRVAIMGETV